MKYCWRENVEMKKSQLKINEDKFQRFSASGKLYVLSSIFKWSNKYLAHVITQPMYSIPNLEYLQRNFCFDFLNDSENTF